MTERRGGLGRGLTALMGDIAGAGAPAEPSPRGLDRTVPIELLHPNPNQPRRAFPPEALEELAASIRARGILQPLIVRPRIEGGYEIVAGERRWRAAQLAQLHEVPVRILGLTDEDVLEVALIENIQREDLNPAEEAEAYRTLIDRFGHTQEALAQALGKSRSHVANMLRLLTLPEPVQAHLRAGRLSAGHARALVGRADAEALAARVIDKGLSVRETEALARRPAPDPARPAPPPAPAKDADTRALEADLAANLGMKVSLELRPGTGSGTLTIRFETLEQLDDLCRVLTAAPLAAAG
jgi:ParB family chromosome partitioning protein